MNAHIEVACLSKVLLRLSTTQYHMEKALKDLGKITDEDFSGLTVNLLIELHDEFSEDFLSMVKEQKDLIEDRLTDIIAISDGLYRLLKNKI